jgi:hypothetical protein
MDLNLFGRVLWRFRYIVIPGLVLAVVLTALSVVKVDLRRHSISYRQSEQWVSYANVFVTQHGFPWGKINPNVPTSTASNSNLQSSDPTRFSSLALLYAQLATGDSVQRIMLRSGPINGQVETAPVLPTAGSSTALPIISIAAIANSPRDAISLASRETDALIQYIADEQQANAIPLGQRVDLQVVKAASQAHLFAGRKKTLPIVVFFTCVLAVVGFVLILENLRPRVRVVKSDGMSVTQDVA